ncbi:alcohol dehydrogenase catalytic domain-containing protein [Nocardioides sp. NPDC057767]|uniref:alcohol dehydrogenase catalytic domain-containing protein n=1 Tax=unclassified Nocardioides TaxID=2615069 RepID=UPI00366A6C8B
MGSTMRAVVYRKFGAGPELVEVPRPEPGPGQVLIEVTAAGLCHSDLAVMSRGPEAFPFGPLPLALGHESAGRVAALGAGVRGIEIGESVAVYGPWGCGRCVSCAHGRENLCPHAGGLGIRAPGLGGPGGLADYQLVDTPRHLVPLGDLDPVTSVSLTDAGLTSYHAITSAAPVLTPGTSAVVVGVGGLGHVAIQILRALSAARVVAVDVDEEKLGMARRLGAAATVTAGETAVQDVLQIIGPDGAALVLDFVGSAATTELAGAVAARGGEVRVIGAGPGAVRIGYRTTAFDVGARFPYWGSLPELHEVIALAQTGAIRVHTERFGLDEVPAAYDRLARGEVQGRAVAVP